MKNTIHIYMYILEMYIYAYEQNIEVTYNHGKLYGETNLICITVEPYIHDITSWRHTHICYYMLNI